MTSAIDRWDCEKVWTEKSKREEKLAELPEWLRNEDAVFLASSLEFHWIFIGNDIRRRRKAILGFSLRSMARWMGISATHLSDLERGNKPWTMTRLQDATDILLMAERGKHQPLPEEKI